MLDDNTAEAVSNEDDGKMLVELSATSRKRRRDHYGG